MLRQRVLYTMGMRAISYVINRFVLRRPKLLARSDKYDLRMRVFTEDVVGRHIYKYGAHEPAITDMLLRELRLGENDVVLDVGANIGWYTLILNSIAANSGARIFAFEPDPTNFQLLRENVTLNHAANVTLIQKGVAELDGVLKLHLFNDRNRGRHSLLPLHEGETVNVETRALDAFWRGYELGDAQPAFIKMDIEGFELVALRGAGEVLARCPFVMLEFSPRYMRAGGLEPRDLIELMQGHGFIAHVLTGDRLERADVAQLLQSDAHTDLFWRRS